MLRNKTSFVQINLELRTPLIVLVLTYQFAGTYDVLNLVLVCEYFIKYSRLCPWLFKRPDYEEEYPGDGDQDVYDN